MTILLAITVGLFFLLYGMHILRHGLETFAGDTFRNLLYQMTATPWRGLWSGTLATAMLQSSTALTVMTVSFVDAGLISFQNALGLILGSNIGTTVTTQLLALPLEPLIPFALLFGALGYLFFPHRWRYLALSFLGLGMLFLALGLLEAGMAPLADLEWIQEILHELGDNHLKGIIVGTILSALLHSSAATTGIVMVLASDGWLTLPTAIAFIYGANIGTCFTALLASVATNRAAQRVAIFHVLLNLFGAILFLPFLTPMAFLLERVSDNVSLQVANAHLLFNVLSSFLAMPLLPYAARLLERIR